VATGGIARRTASASAGSIDHLILSSLQLIG
jgi:hypothetical protein